jgi:hypothetical protein
MLLKAKMEVLARRRATQSLVWRKGTRMKKKSVGLMCIKMRKRKEYKGHTCRLNFLLIKGILCKMDNDDENLWGEESTMEDTRQTLES